MEWTKTEAWKNRQVIRAAVAASCCVIDAVDTAPGLEAHRIMDKNPMLGSARAAVWAALRVRYRDEQNR